MIVQAPLALHLIIEAGIGKLISSALLSLVMFLGPSVAVDYFYYQKPVIAAWNILTYNVFNSHTGSDLYGVEPWYYYLLNGFLNFNIILPLAFVSAPVGLVAMANNTSVGSDGPCVGFGIACTKSSTNATVFQYMDSNVALFVVLLPLVRVHVRHPAQRRTIFVRSLSSHLFRCSGGNVLYYWVTPQHLDICSLRV